MCFLPFSPLNENNFAFQLFNIYIKKAADIYGVPKTRQIYEKAIEVLTEDNCREMCLRFAEMETKLGEIDRARAIYAHCSQVCDPRVSPRSRPRNTKDFFSGQVLLVFQKNRASFSMMDFQKKREFLINRKI